MSAPDGRIRVLWLIKGLGAGGAERLLHSAARVADHRRFAYEAAYVLPWKSALVPDLAASGVRVHCLNGHRRVEPGWPSRLRALLASGRYDVLHLHSPLVGGVARGVVLTLPASRRPVVVSTEHNEWSSFRLPTRLANAALYGRDAARWAVSEDVRQSVWPCFRDAVEVVVHGVVLSDISQDAKTRSEVRREVGVTDDETLVGTVANYRLQKAYPDLLRAARIALAADPRLRFAAVGQGPLLGEVMRLHEQLGLGDRLLHLGQRDDVPRLLNAFDVFALASHYEGFPVSVMEALAAGLPLVVTDVGGIRGTVVDGVHGRVVPPGRPEVLAEAILELAADESSRRRMAAAARRLGHSFDIRAAVGRIEQGYLDVLQLSAARTKAGSVA